MRLSDFCNRTTTRAPHGLPDSQVRPSKLRHPCGRSARHTPAHFQPMASGEPPGEASLDGEPSASALSQPVPGRGDRVTPIAAVGVMLRGPGGASIERSSALHLPTAALSTASRACDVASDALSHGPAEPIRPFGRTFPMRTARHRLHRGLIKDRRFVAARTPSLDECSLPCKERLRLSPPPLGLAPPPVTALLSHERSPGGTGSSTARHRALGFAAASRLRTPFRRRARAQGARPAG